eukprot:CAMPEP_0113900378 /NCGR_PEP_ID=MMETSP0780_2-20120614/20636_1 /TAXON_ID=652834 /ORGANISM="Palpitomonas bilix" /LENGTH=648 /DNA_ID=CAMNT_0000892815 /DNA_START=27 /DNA_END=1973 /DNA_ORIENTATION=+ /assembly_acc=CAM_ASM_000599
MLVFPTYLARACMCPLSHLRADFEEGGSEESEEAGGEGEEGEEDEEGQATILSHQGRLFLVRAGRIVGELPSRIFRSLFGRGGGEGGGEEEEEEGAVEFEVESSDDGCVSEGDEEGEPPSQPLRVQMRRPPRRASRLPRRAILPGPKKPLWVKKKMQAEAVTDAILRDSGTPVGADRRRAQSSVYSQLRRREVGLNRGRLEASPSLGSTLHASEEVEGQSERRGIKRSGQGEDDERKKEEGGDVEMDTSNTSVTTKYVYGGRSHSLAGMLSPTERVHIGHRFLPNTVREANLTRVDEERGRIYGSKFSRSGQSLVVYGQDEMLHIFDGNDGLSPIREIIPQDVRWTVTDTDVAPNERFVAYSSITSDVHLCNIYGDDVLHDTLPFADGAEDSHFGIWCIRFSADGREIVASTNGGSFIRYDVERKVATSTVHAHDNDINAVAFADFDYNPHLIVTGSDDSSIKVWDQRALAGRSRRPSGILLGHTEGITHICPKGDGRYIVSNGKDQCARLFDLRKCRDSSEHTLSTIGEGSTGFDYRWMAYPSRQVPKHSLDCSVVKYSGHSVLQTLIRCYFTPMSTTGQQYVVTGSSDGVVRFYDVLTGRIVHALSEHEDVVRDVSMHPTESVLVTSSWDGRVKVWEYGEAHRAAE